MSMIFEKGKFYDVCEVCGEIFEVEVIEFDGPHDNCTIRGKHYHSKQPFPLCPRCRRV